MFIISNKLNSFFIMLKKINKPSLYIPSISADHYYVPTIDGEEYNFIGETEDIALLLALQMKYEGRNYQFTKHACRMLNITSTWSGD